MAHCPHVDNTFVPPSINDEYCCRCGVVRVPKHAPEPGHGPFLKQPQMRRVNPWLWDEICQGQSVCGLCQRPADMHMFKTCDQLAAEHP